LQRALPRRAFQFGGLKRNDPVKKYALKHDDVAVWEALRASFFMAFRNSRTRIVRPSEARASTLRSGVRFRVSCFKFDNNNRSAARAGPPIQI